MDAQELGTYREVLIQRVHGCTGAGNVQGGTNYIDHVGVGGCYVQGHTVE